MRKTRRAGGLARLLFGPLVKNRKFCDWMRIPWVSVQDFPSRAGKKYRMLPLDIEWNRHFITKLRKAGYEGEDEVLVEKWVINRIKEVEQKEIESLKQEAGHRV